ncbi:protein starmaker-like [Mytilus edulis]|uniref:protein starmaker-like n=1 Tax=Mytilus edulis TaxID=6550 RepID=UPI0039EE3002
MAEANVDPKSSSKSYAEAVSPRDQSSNDQSVSEVKPIFILEQDLFGSSKPSQDQYLTHLELYRAVEHLVDPSHLKALQRTCGKSGHTAKYCNADSDSSSEDSQSESESDSDIPTHPESCQNDVSQTTQAADAEHKTPNFTFNKQTSNNLDDHSNLSEKKANRQVKKAKRAKNKKNKQNTNKDQPSMERFLAEAFRTPSNKNNEEKKNTY